MTAGCDNEVVAGNTSLGISFQETPSLQLQSLHKKLPRRVDVGPFAAVFVMGNSCFRG